MSIFTIVIFLVCVSYEGNLISAQKNGPDIDATHLRILDEMRPEYIRESLRYLSEYPHNPGTARNRKLAEYVADRWRNSGFDKTEIYPYNILMSFPEQPSEVWLHSNETVDRKIIIGNEPPFDHTEEKGVPVYPYHAFSPNGTVTGEYVYANYGREEDFDILRKFGVSITGKVVIVRYGKGFRGGKVTLAENYGAIGVIIYSDPADHTYSGMEYPDGWMLNEFGVQRGTVNRLSGDALSDGYPSKPHYFRYNITKYSGNPTIPTQPISYATAFEIFKNMDNDTVPLPVSFQGGFNITYSVQSGHDRQITLKVSTELETREAWTVCTTLFGREQPDRYVMLGNHRDAWTYGAGDPSSGTANMLEVIRSIGKIVNETGWRPKRSLKACSWGAEEVGALDSTEWTDENHQFISEKVTAYLNTDIAVEGNFTVRLKALRFIGDGIFKVAKAIIAPDNSNKTLYEDWLEKSITLKNNNTLENPFFYTPAAGSDYKAFWHTYGTTIADFRYQFSRVDYPIHSLYSLYHTRYESFGWMEKYVDPNFKYHLTIAKLWAGYLMLMADTTIIPFNLYEYTVQVEEFFNQLELEYKELLDNQSISLDFARHRLSALNNKTKAFQEYVHDLNLNKTSDFELRSVNDKIMKFEQNFLVTGITTRTSSRHVIYSGAPNHLKATKFPGITEAIYFAATDPRNDWDEVRKQITLLVWCFDTANTSLDLDEWSH